MEPGLNSAPAARAAAGEERGAAAAAAGLKMGRRGSCRRSQPASPIPAYVSSSQPTVQKLIDAGSQPQARQGQELPAAAATLHPDLDRQAAGLTLYCATVDHTALCHRPMRRRGSAHLRPRRRAVRTPLPASLPPPEVFQPRLRLCKWAGTPNAALGSCRGGSRRGQRRTTLTPRWMGWAIGRVMVCSLA